ncbi:MAG: hypothetical protein JOZ00_00660 [Mycobacterium sp.]|uniref:hypothetical protein n=1 Tax=Mycobacterium sp. TaxID=1785 RepID=UPI001ECEE11A|nr:hypothetical protein [Mycobacterium sp.]MBV8785183.1 hypothetical protein [Mycobacterium sp.]
MSVPLPAGLIDLLRRPSPCFEDLSHQYLGRPYPNFSGVPETRFIVSIKADSVTETG